MNNMFYSKCESNGKSESESVRRMSSLNVSLAALDNPYRTRSVRYLEKIRDMRNDCECVNGKTAPPVNGLETLATDVIQRKEVVSETINNRSHSKHTSNEQSGSESARKITPVFNVPQVETDNPYRTRSIRYLDKIRDMRRDYECVNGKTGLCLEASSKEHETEKSQRSISRISETIANPYRTRSARALERAAIKKIDAEIVNAESGVQSDETIEGPELGFMKKRPNSVVSNAIYNHYHTRSTRALYKSGTKITDAETTMDGETSVRHAAEIKRPRLDSILNSVVSNVLANPCRTRNAMVLAETPMVRKTGVQHDAARRVPELDSITNRSNAIVCNVLDNPVALQNAETKIRDTKITKRETGIQPDAIRKASESSSKEKRTNSVVSNAIHNQYRTRSARALEKAGKEIVESVGDRTKTADSRFKVALIGNNTIYDDLVPIDNTFRTGNANALEMADSTELNIENVITTESLRQKATATEHDIHPMELDAISSNKCVLNNPYSTRSTRNTEKGSASYRCNSQNISLNNGNSDRQGVRNPANEFVASESDKCSVNTGAESEHSKVIKRSETIGGKKALEQVQKTVGSSPVEEDEIMVIAHVSGAQKRTEPEVIDITLDPVVAYGSQDKQNTGTGNILQISDSSSVSENEKSSGLGAVQKTKSHTVRSRFSLLDSATQIEKELQSLHQQEGFGNGSKRQKSVFTIASSSTNSTLLNEPLAGHNHGDSKVLQINEARNLHRGIEIAAAIGTSARLAPAANSRVADRLRRYKRKPLGKLGKAKDTPLTRSQTFFLRMEAAGYLGAAVRPEKNPMILREASLFLSSMPNRVLTRSRTKYLKLF